MVRGEVEHEIDRSEFDFLCKCVVGNFIIKTRHYSLVGKHVVEIDVYGGRLNGLVTIEVEFTTEDEAHKFKAPVWFGKEVTDSDEYKNKISIS